MFSRYFFSKTIKPSVRHKPLKIDNTYQTLIEPKVFHKSALKFTMTPPEYESIQQDSFLKNFKIFSPKYFNDMTRYPDHDELLIDVETFELIPYLKYLMKTKWDDLEPKDEFLYRVLQLYLFFVLHIILKETLFYFYEENTSNRNMIQGGVKSKLSLSQTDTHFNYLQFEKEFDYNMILFKRSIKRINNELDID